MELIAVRNEENNNVVVELKMWGNQLKLIELVMDVSFLMYEWSNQHQIRANIHSKL